MDQEQFAGHALRGQVIDLFCQLERAINVKISLSFIPEGIKMVYMELVIMDRLTFETKRQILSHLLKIKSKKEGFIKTKNNTHPYSKMLLELDKLNKIRNFFAHHRMVGVLGENLTFLESRDSFDFKSYSMDEIKDIKIRISNLTEKIYEINFPDNLFEFQN